MSAGSTYISVMLYVQSMRKYLTSDILIHNTSIDTCNLHVQHVILKVTSIDIIQLNIQNIPIKDMPIVEAILVAKKSKEHFLF